MNEGLELSVNVVGRGTVPQNVKDTDAALVRLKGRSETTNEAFLLTQRRAEKLAEEGLGAIFRISPQVGNAISDLGAKSPAVATALRALGAGAASAFTALAGFEIGRSIRDLWELRGAFTSVQEAVEHAGDAFEYWQYKMQRALDQERAYITARGALQQSFLASKQGTIEARGAREASMLRGAFAEPSEGSIAAIDREKKAKLDALDVVQQREDAAIRRTALTAEGRANAERELAALSKRFTEERARIAIDYAQRRIREEADLKSLQLQRAQEVRDAEQAVYQAQTEAQAGLLAGELRLSAAIRTRTDAEIAAVRTGAEKQIAIWQDEVNRRQRSEENFAQLRTALTAESSAKIVGILQKEQEARRALIYSGPVPYAPAGDRAALARNVVDTRAAVREAQQTPIEAPVVGTDLGARVQRWYEIQTATDAARVALEAYNLELNRPRGGEGLSAVQETVDQAKKEAERLAALQASGALVPRDMLVEVGRNVDALDQQWAKLRQEYANTPAVLDAIDRAQRQLDYGGFSSLVNQAAQSQGTLAERMSQVQPAATAAAGGVQVFADGMVFVANATAIANGKLREFLQLTAAMAGAAAPEGGE